MFALGEISLIPFLITLAVLKILPPSQSEVAWPVL